MCWISESLKARRFIILQFYIYIASRQVMRMSTVAKESCNAFRACAYVHLPSWPRSLRPCARPAFSWLQVPVQVVDNYDFGVPHLHTKDAGAKCSQLTKAKEDQQHNLNLRLVGRL